MIVQLVRVSLVESKWSTIGSIISPSGQSDGRTFVERPGEGRRGDGVGSGKKDCLTLEDGTDRLSRKVGNKPQFYPARYPKRSQIS